LTDSFSSPSQPTGSRGQRVHSMSRDIIVVGTSAGGIEALRALVGGLPENFSASIFIVLHTSPQSPGILDAILERAGPLPAVAPHDRERIQPGRIYVAPPDYHMLLEPGVVRITRGPKENRFRPAIDPLFRSAAQTYGPRVTGIILTGGLDDGTAGLWAIKRLGGTAIVQDPTEALAASMPRNAMNHVEVDYCLPLAEIAPLLVRLTSEEEEASDEGDYQVPEKMEIEVRIAKEDMALEAGVLKLGEPSIYACPECHGVLLKLQEGNNVRFRCHTGHAYSVDTLLAEFTEQTEEALWNAIRCMEESVMLMKHLAAHYSEQKQNDAARALLKKAQESQQRTDLVRRVSINHEKLSEEKIESA
jgi:two-component system, chemotaxis family, protein-glutamate methylesterase/glutaminase